jgi:uncharacterized protein YoxC
MLALVSAGGIWIADTAGPGISTGLTWVDKYGLAIAFLIVCLFAINVLFKANQNLNRELTNRAQALVELQTKTTDALKNSSDQNRQVAEALERSTSAVNQLSGAVRDLQLHNTR